MKQIDPEVLTELSAAEIDGQNVRLTRQIDRKLYLKCNDVLTSLGGVWTKKAKAHVFPDDPAERIDNALLTGSYERLKDVKQTFGWFPTPPPLVKRVIELAQLKPRMTVLEPSAGEGAIADAAAEIVGRDNIYTCEIRDEARGILQLKGYNTAGDFLKLERAPLVDRVLMNPPFRLLADVDHVRHAWTFLKPGGRLVSIMSISFTFRADKKSAGFREFVKEYGYWKTNREGSFKPSGTEVGTVIVVMDKPA